jgi:hypothetical protein
MRLAYKLLIFSDALAPTRETEGKVHYQLTPEIIHKIFVNYPGVRAAYKKHVPDKVLLWFFLG